GPVRASGCSKMTRSAAPRTAVLIVLAANGQRDPVTGWHHDRGRPDFDVELDHFALLERLLLVVGVIGTIRQRQLLVEFAVRGAQPPLRDRRVRIDRTLEYRFP